MVPLPEPVLTVTVYTALLLLMVTPVIMAPLTVVWVESSAKSSASTPSTGSLNVAVKLMLAGVIPFRSWLVVVMNTVGYTILYVTMAVAQFIFLLFELVAL